MNDVELSEQLCDFIEASPSMFHTAFCLTRQLEAEGFVRLRESEAWAIERGGSYYVTRNGSSVIAFKVGEQLPTDGYRFQMAAAHTDSPTYKVKHNPELDGPGQTLRLDVEPYGGMLDATWLDRPLGIAGRVVVRTPDGGIETRLIASDRDVAIIPNVAVHQRRNAQEGFAINRQVDMCPLFSAGELGHGSFDAMVAELAGVEPSSILGKDVYLVNRTKPRVWGWASEFVSAPKLDDLQCAFALATAFTKTCNDNCVTVFACFDNEEVGSGTRQGALSTFLRDALCRVNGALGFGEQDYLRALAGSFMVSCDNGHAIHPNHPEFYDANNCPHINGGVVIKETARQKYATDAFTRAIFTAICEDAGVPVQTFANHSDSLGGSTLGNLSIGKVSVPTVDIGLAQLAMHSCYETAGVHDTGYLVRALQAYYACDLRINATESATLR